MVDRSATAFYKNHNIDFFMSILNNSNSRLDALTDFQRKRLETEVKGIHIQVRHLTYKRKYKAIGLSKRPATETLFNFEKANPDGKKETNTISVSDFYKFEHKKDLAHPEFPCLIVGSEKRKNYLPLELCELVPDQHVNQRLTDIQSAVMIRLSASQKPMERFASIRNSANIIKNDGKPYLMEFGIQISPSLLEIDSHVIDPPDMIYKEGNKESIVKPENGNWKLQNKKFYRTPAINSNWVLINFSNKTSANDISTLVDGLKNNKLGLLIKDPFQPPLQAYLPGKLKEFIFEKAKRAVKDLKMIIFVLPENAALYQEIKFTGDVQLNLPTQCIHERNMKKINNAFVTNLLYKINTKLGGVNTVISKSCELPEILKKSTTQVIGIDVSLIEIYEKNLISIYICSGHSSITY